MKKYLLLASVLALMLSLSPAALADYENGGVRVQTQSAAELMGERITQVSAGEALSGSEGMAPVAENQEITTYRGVSVGGRLKATDPEGGQLYFELTTEPMKGSVELAADGHFVYTPGENKRGKDYFGFRAVDEQGNRSQEGTVLIQLKRQTGSIRYSDLTGEACAYSAALLAAEGIFVGEKLGSDYVFHPEQTVSRGEFLSMCMVLGGDDILSGAISTGFLDDEAIETWMKPYVSTALMEGYIQGNTVTGGATFDPSEDIRLEDACSILNEVLGITNVVNLAQDSSQAAVNLQACGVLDSYDDPDRSLTRAQAASMLAEALELLQQR